MSVARLIILVLASAAIFGCNRRITVTPAEISLSQYLQEKEGMEYGCASIEYEDPTESDCAAVYKLFSGARACYAATVDSRASKAKMGEVQWYMPIGYSHPQYGRALTMDSGALAWAYFEPYTFLRGPYGKITFVHLPSVWHETMHFLHWKYHGTDKRVVLDEWNSARYIYEVIAHGTADDPIYRHSCARPAGS